MRLREADKRPVTVHAPAESANEDVYAWGPGTPIRAVLQPLSGALERQRWGDRAASMRLMLYDGPFRLSLGMGVCVNVPGPCDYRVVELEGWDHQRATLEMIQEGNRQ